MVTPLYQPREPGETILYQVIAEHLETFLATLTADPTAKGLPEYVREEFYAYLQCGILAHGCVRLGCDTCPHQMLLAFSCKKRGFCPSCAGRRMAQQAAHLVEQVIPWVPTRQWVVSVPIPLRYWMAPSRELTARVHTIIRLTIGQYYVNQAVKRGATRATVQSGSVTFLQRFGGSINGRLGAATYCLWRAGRAEGTAHWLRLWRRRRAANPDRHALCQR
jgi:Transposase zinc-binding domain